MELVSGVCVLVAGLVLWNAGWWHWLLIGAGLLGLSPWPGAQAILWRADRKPGVLIDDPERRWRRGRRVALVQVGLSAIAGFVVGYVVDGLGAAIFMGVVLGLGAALGAWLFLRRSNR